ncbi:hypothetical protein [uncultured Sulfitobacter sp.]|uniref:hypothetical protein n=1 Tax=uncultured Sulfitobacter sp. TaxID=191468 RepID=UPI00262D121D|nr:hypothetical protein [uncultured Sulfitobacter sp.]
MPLAPFITLLLFVIIASGVTIWLMTSAGPTVLMIALPVFLIATAALMWLRK